MGYRREIRELVRLAAPLAAAQAGTQMMGLVDIAVLGRVGARELGGAGLGNAVFFAMSVIGIGIVYGVDPMISQALGAHEHVRARRLLWQGSWLALAVSGALTLVLLALAALLPYFGVQPELVSPARTFLLIRMLSLAPFLLFFVVRSYLQAQGTTRPLIAAMVAANIVNFALDVLLVFGAGPLPPLGVAGAALSTLAATFAELWIVIAAVKRIRIDEPFDHRWNAREVALGFRVGLPVGLQMGAEVGIFALVGVLAAQLGTLHLAAHQTVIGLISFTYTAALGIAAAGSVRVGKAVGARDPHATRVAGHAAMLAGAAFMLIPALAFAFVPRAVARLITDQPDVLAAAIPLFLVAAVFQLSDGTQGVGAGVLRGAGDTKFTFYANLLGHWMIGLPVALWLGFHLHLGIVGFWWGLCAGLTIVAVLLFLRFEKLSRGEITPL
ncbi:MAG TPA: MATE family efflux transporter [Thermoanaerobaculia bacterium]|nr:MATE family efflux transporter [Thermoanaerobaculia bacterium]